MTFVVTPWIALAVFGFIILLAIATAWYMGSAKEFEQSRIKIFTAVLAGLGIIVTMIFYYSIVTVQQQQQTLTIVQETARISNAISFTIPDEIKQASVYIPAFCHSLLPLMMCDDDIDEEEEDELSYSNCSKRYILSLKIFSVWQDVIISERFLKVDTEAYINHFIQHANSMQLHEQWQRSKYDFNEETRLFGDMLFEYGLKINKRCPIMYNNATKKFLEDERTKMLFH